MTEASNSKYPDIFVLTADTVQNYDGSVIPFPDTLVVWGSTENEYSISEAVKSANEELRRKANKLKANAVISTSYTKIEKIGDMWWTSATGTPAYFDPPLSEMYDELKLLKSQDEE